MAAKIGTEIVPDIAAVYAVTVSAAEAHLVKALRSNSSALTASGLTGAVLTGAESAAETISMLAMKLLIVRPAEPKRAPGPTIADSVVFHGASYTMPMLWRV